LTVSAAWPPEDQLDAETVAVANHAYRGGEPTGAGTEHAPQTPWLFLPLRTPVRPVGVIEIAQGSGAAPLDQQAQTYFTPSLSCPPPLSNAHASATRSRKRAPRQTRRLRLRSRAPRCAIPKAIRRRWRSRPFSRSATSCVPSCAAIRDTHGCPAIYEEGGGPCSLTTQGTSCPTLRRKARRSSSTFTR
jgi:hypothetical protein